MTLPCWTRLLCPRPIILPSCTSTEPIGIPPAANPFFARVLDPDGRGVAAQIGVAPFDGSGSWLTDSDGLLDMRTAPTEPTLMCVRHEDWALTTVLIDARAARGETEIRLVAGTLVELRAARGAWEGTEVLVARAEGTPLAMRRVHPAYPWRVRLAPGRYEVRVLRDREVVRVEPLEVGRERIVREVVGP